MRIDSDMLRYLRGNARQHVNRALDEEVDRTLVQRPSEALGREIEAARRRLEKRRAAS